MEELVSIIVPVYNVEKYVAKCMESIISQTYKNIEIIVMIDGSKDNSQKIVEEYKKKDERIKIYSRENRGLLYTRIEGLEKASGNYIMYVDSDDWIEKSMVEEMMKIQKQYKADIVRCCFFSELVEQNKSIPTIGPYNKLEIIKKENFKKKIYPIYLENYSLNNIWSQIIRKDIISTGNIDSSIMMGEDLAFNLELFSSINTFVFIPTPLYHYRKNNQTSITRSLKKENVIRLIDDTKKVYTSLFNYLDKWDMNNEKNKKLVSLRVLKEISLQMYNIFLIEGIEKKEIQKIIQEYLECYELDLVRDNLNLNEIKDGKLKDLYNRNIKNILKRGKTYKIIYNIKQVIKKVIFR